MLIPGAADIWRRSLAGPLAPCRGQRPFCISAEGLQCLQGLDLSLGFRV